MQQSPHQFNTHYTNAWLSLGANLGAAQETVIQTIKDIAKWQHTKLIKSSSLYKSAPVDAVGNDYINAVVEISTKLPVLQLLQLCRTTERDAGRKRTYRNAPRTLDIDILLYGEQCVNEKDLIVPHPRMYQRAFVLLPLAEISPHLVTEEQLNAVLNQAIEPIK